MASTPGILEQFDTYAMYNISSVEHANIVALGEGHKNSHCRQWNGRYISYVAKKGRVAIFVEGYLSMKSPILSIKRLKELLEIDADVPDENIQVFGWDIDPKILESKQQYFQQELAQFTQKADILLEKRNALDTELSTLKTDIQKIIPEFAIEKCESMGLNWFCSLQDENYTTFNNQLTQYLAAYAKRQEVQLACQSLTYPEPTFIKETLFLRAESMAKTARTVEELQGLGQFPPLAIFIAGIAHLCPPSSDTDHAFQLKPWQEEIAHHKAAVLIEKEAYRQFLQEGV